MWEEEGGAAKPYRAELIGIYDCDMQTRSSGPGGTVGPLSGPIFFHFCLSGIFQDSSKLTGSSL